MAEIPDWLLRHTATIEPYLGAGPSGALYGPAVTVACFVVETRRMVRDATGRQVISGTTVLMGLDQVCPVESRVGVHGRSSTVLTAARQDGGGLPTPDHLEVSLR